MLEFDGADRQQHDAVNARLGLDPESGKRDRPGLPRSQTGAAKPAAEIVEAWETPDAYEQLIHGRLEQATHQSHDHRDRTRRVAHDESLTPTPYVAPGA